MGTLTQPGSLFSGGFTIRGDIDFDNEGRITNVPDPQSNSDVVTKGYVDTQISGVDLSAGSGVKLDNETLSIDFDSLTGPGIEENNNAFRISSSIAGDGISGGSGTALSVNVSDIAGNGIQADGSANLELVNTEIQINGSNGLSGGSAALGNSVDISISGNLSLDSDLVAIDGETIWSESNTHVPESALESLSNSGLTNSSISINGTEVDLGGSITLEVATAGSYLSKTGDTLNVNLGNGLEGDGSDNVRVRGDEVAGNALEEGSSAYTIDVSNNSIGTTEIDESITPTWTGKHTFDGGIEFGTLFVGNDSGDSQLANMGVTSTPSAGTQQSYSFDIDNSPILTVYSEADGSGGTQNEEVRVNGDIKTSGELTEGAAL